MCYGRQKLKDNYHGPKNKEDGSHLLCAYSMPGTFHSLSHLMITTTTGNIYQAFALVLRFKCFTCVSSFNPHNNHEMGQTPLSSSLLAVRNRFRVAI